MAHTCASDCILCIDTVTLVHLMAYCVLPCPEMFIFVYWLGHAFACDGILYVKLTTNVHSITYCVFPQQHITCALYGMLYIFLATHVYLLTYCVLPQPHVYFWHVVSGLCQTSASYGILCNTLAVCPSYGLVHITLATHASYGYFVLPWPYITCATYYMLCIVLVRHMFLMTYCVLT